MKFARGLSCQPKSSKLPPLMPEFAYTQRLISAQLPPLDDKRLLTMPWMGVPKHARLLRSSEVEKGSSADSRRVPKAESSSDSWGHQPTPGVCQRPSHQATPHFFSQVPSHQAIPHFFSLFRCKSVCQRRSHQATPGVISRLQACAKGRVIKRLLTSSAKCRVIRRFLTSSVSSDAKAPESVAKATVSYRR